MRYDKGVPKRDAFIFMHLCKFRKESTEEKMEMFSNLKISAYPYPALAVYNAGAALYRSFGKTSTTMHVSAAGFNTGSYEVVCSGK